MLLKKKSRSVLMEIARFMVAYIFLLIGFMMSFMVCFADQDAFQNFPGMFIKVRLRSHRINCPGKDIRYEMWLVGIHVTYAITEKSYFQQTTPEQKIGIIFIRSPP